ncbi:MAG TPA: hypothetical protein VIF60_24270 [Burkholderiaceae bacterium]
MMGLFDQALQASSNNGQPVFLPNGQSPPDQIVNGMILPHNDVMATMPWGKLIALRNQAGSNAAAQAAIAPYEHQAYARETVADNPLMALPWAILPVGYQGAKLLGLMPTDEQSTPPSWKQLAHGEGGVVEGLANGITNRVRSIFD